MGRQQCYPEPLNDLMVHGGRFAHVLLKFEKERPESTWTHGRVGQMKIVFNEALRDMREGVNTFEQTCQSLDSYLHTLHQGALRRMRGRLELSCCQDCTTRYPLTDAVRPDYVTTARFIVESQNAEPTDKSGWKDTPEMIGRMERALPLLDAIALTLHVRIRHVCSFEDLRAFGLEGLLNAARSYDSERGIPYMNWASVRIRSSMINGVRSWGVLTRSMLDELRALSSEEENDDIADSSTSGVSSKLTAIPKHVPIPDEMHLVDQKPNPEEAIEYAEQIEKVREAIKELSSEERAVVEAVFYSDKTLAKAAKKIGHSESWGCRLLARALSSIELSFRRSHGRVPKARRLSRKVIV